MQVKSSANVTERRRVIIKKCKAFYFTLFQPFLQVNLCKAKMFTSPVYFFFTDIFWCATKQVGET
jgi:hypothetical protein